MKWMWPLILRAVPSTCLLRSSRRSTTTTMRRCTPLDVYPTASIRLCDLMYTFTKRVGEVGQEDEGKSLEARKNRRACPCRFLESLILNCLSNLACCMY